MFDEIGPFDHLAYTAGDTVWRRTLSKIQIGEARQFFDVIFWGALFASKHGARKIRPGGSIVLTSSTPPRRPAPGFAIGTSISSAVEGLARAMAVELAPIRVNVVAPGIVHTPIWDRLPENDRAAFFSARSKSIPVGKVGAPEDVAQAYVSFMRGAFTTGQTLVVDGGMVLI
jgi:NAD(P)-dependent dehydrogenase (short-subunit alcohol dehydrogenase family)